MKPIIEYLEMDINEYKSMLEKSKPIFVKSIWDSFRQVQINLLEDEISIDKFNAIKSVTKEVLETKGHVQNKNERKEQRKIKQLEKQNR